MIHIEDSKYDYSSLKEELEASLRKALKSKNRAKISKEKTAELGRVVPPKSKNLPDSYSEVKSIRSLSERKTVDLTAVEDFSPLPSVNWFEVLKKDLSVAKRREAARNLIKLSNPAVVNAIVDSMLKDESSEVRLEAVECIVKLGDKKALNGLMKGLKEEKDIDVRKRIAWAYSQLKYKSS